ncbi:GNAT family N-acetyltransferase [Granulicella sp. S190]|uniref:GNAT family N-acetyltransferase n=1 Tax=Granulicella sp. S190 TaxID=1747226 RepID=UPI00131CE706|nr:GNAT family N-acetyltransferase [Granulicella sp. S190]
MQQTKTELEESLHQFVTTWRLLARPFPQADLSDKPSLAVSWPSTHFPFYNMVFLTEELRDTDVLGDRVREAATYLRTNQATGMFLVCLDRLNGTAENSFSSILKQEKLVPAIPMTGMAGDVLPLAGTAHPEVRFVRISDDKTIQTFAEINCAAYGLPAETALSLVKEHTLWSEHAYGFLAYVGDTPVATATAIVNDDCIFLFLVATMPDAQRKGYGNAVVRHALNTAYEATGIMRSVLHATEAGYPVYLRLGYHPTGKFIGCMLES